jgi:hypothetical protein
MTRLTQTTLECKTQILVANGRRPEAQAVLAAVGCGPAALDEGAALLDAMRQSRVSRQAALAAQKEATGREAQAARAAGRHIASLTRTARTLFAADEPTLTALGLITRYTHTSGRRAVQPSRAVAEVLARWRQLVDNAARLDGDVAAQLSAAGWPVERLDETAALVEVYAAADTAQQAAIQAHRQAAARFKTDVAALRAWYARAAALIRIAIRDADPTDAAQLHDLLGLRM